MLFPVSPESKFTRWPHATNSARALLRLGGVVVALAAVGRTYAAEPAAALIREYCIDCHDSGQRKGDLSLEDLDPAQAPANPIVWEKVVEKLHHRQMPPLGEPRPDDEVYARVVAALTESLDGAAAAAPNPGRTETFRRLNRTEYQNAIRDLLAVEIDATTLLPNDEPSHGFDNVTVGNLSPTLLDRYVSAAQKIARLALGTPRKTPAGDTFRIKPDVTQEDHVEGLPLGTRGGARIAYTFPQDGEYEILVRLARDRNEQVEGLKRRHEIEVLIDRERVASAIVKPPGSDKNAEAVDAHLKFRVPVKAGPHDVGVTFPKLPSLLIETERQPFVARYNLHRHPRTAPAVYQVTINGPYRPQGPGDTPSRRLILGPLGATELEAAGEEERARRVLTPLIRLAFRRTVTPEDLRRPMEFFRTATANLRAAEAAAGVGHHVALSVVGTERLAEQSGYFRAKLAQESLIRDGAVPHTIVRATQFFEFVRGIADAATEGDVVRVAPVQFQPIASAEVAEAVAIAALGRPVQSIAEIAGPQRYRLDELIRTALTARGDRRTVVADPRARYWGAELADDTLLPKAGATLFGTQFEEWLLAASAHDLK